VIHTFLAERSFRKGDAMPLNLSKGQRMQSLVLVLISLLMPLAAGAASCKTQSQMTPEQREAVSSTARNIVGEIQSGDTQTLRAKTVPAVAADFSGIAGSVDDLKPLVQRAAITIESLYMLDALAEPGGTTRTDFYCGTPLVVLHFSDLPAGTYAVVILHATGVSQPQQISLILSETTERHWMLAGFFRRPMVEAGHDGLWYWTSARSFVQKNMNWNAWFYYRTAAYLLAPADFLSSPNLQKLEQEEARIRPDSLPGTNPVLLDVHGSVFQVTAIDTTATLGSLDLEVHYAADNVQAGQLHDPVSARKQVTEVMATLLVLHPELQQAFHGIWVYADVGPTSLFSLELPMDQIFPVIQVPAMRPNSVPQ
jgi:hypothetical protein